MMYDYRAKVSGMVIAGVGLVALVAQKLTHFTLLRQYDADQHFNFLIFLTTMGLFTVMFSKEKIEDERVQAVRSKSLLYAFLLAAGTPIAFAMLMSLDPASMIDSGALTNAGILEQARLLMFYPAAGISLYLVMFHIGLYFDSAWDYEDKAWSPRSVVQHPRYKLIRLAISLAVLLLMFLLFR